MNTSADASYDALERMLLDRYYACGPGDPRAAEKGARRARAAAEGHAALGGRLRAALEAAAPGCAVVDWCDDEEPGLWFLVLLHPGQPVLDNDDELQRALGGDRRDLEVFASALAPVWAAKVERTSNPGDRAADYVFVDHDPPWEEEPFASVARAMAREGFSRIPAEQAWRIVPGAETECTAPGETAAFHLLFHDIESAWPGVRYWVSAGTELRACAPPLPGAPAAPPDALAVAEVAAAALLQGDRPGLDLPRRQLAAAEPASFEEGPGGFLLRYRVAGEDPPRPGARTLFLDGVACGLGSPDEPGCAFALIFAGGVLVALSCREVGEPWRGSARRGAPRMLGAPWTPIPPRLSDGVIDAIGKDYRAREARGEEGSA